MTCIWTLLTSCARDVPPEQRQFAETVAEMLKEQHEVVVRAEQVAPFPWQSWCFERADDVLLTFKSADSTLTMRFDYENLFIDEAYVPGSPAGHCVTRQTQLRLKRIYPGKSELIGIYLEQR